MALNERNLRFFQSEDALGGDVTGTPADAIFENVRGLQAEAGMTDYACIYFVNRDPDEAGLLDPELWLTPRPGTRSTVSLGVDPSGKNGVAQRISNRFEAPDGVVFVSSAPSMPFRLPSAPYYQDDRIPIWIRREVPQGASPGPEGFRLMIRGEAF